MISNILAEAEDQLAHILNSPVFEGCYTDPVIQRRLARLRWEMADIRANIIEPHPWELKASAVLYAAG